jgi:hypothetical protein
MKILSSKKFVLFLSFVFNAKVLAQEYNLNKEPNSESKVSESSPPSKPDSLILWNDTLRSESHRISNPKILESFVSGTALISMGIAGSVLFRSQNITRFGFLGAQVAGGYLVSKGFNLLNTSSHFLDTRREFRSSSDDLSFSQFRKAWQKSEQKIRDANQISQIAFWSISSAVLGLETFIDKNKSKTSQLIYTTSAGVSAAIALSHVTKFFFFSDSRHLIHSMSFQFQSPSAFEFALLLN